MTNTDQNEPIHKREHILNAGKREPTEHKRADSLWECALDRIVCHVGESDMIKDVVRGYGYTPIQSSGLAIREHTPTLYHFLLALGAEEWRKTTTTWTSTTQLK